MTSSVCVLFVSWFHTRRRNARSRTGLLRSVNPSRKLRRFESFTCHHQRKQPLTCGNADQGLFRRVPGCPTRSGYLRVCVAYFWLRRREGRRDPAPRETLQVIEGVGVDPQQHRHAVASPRCHLCGRDSRREPCGQAGVAQLIWAPCHRRRLLFGRDRGGPCELQHPGCHGRRDWPDEGPGKSDVPRPVRVTNSRSSAPTPKVDRCWCSAATSSA